MSKSQSRYKQQGTDMEIEARSGGTDPAGRPQPGSGNAGDSDKPRKSPAGPQTAIEKAASKANKKTGKRAAAKKVSSARGRKAIRRGQLGERAKPGHSTEKKSAKRKK